MKDNNFQYLAEQITRLIFLNRSLPLLPRMIRL